MSYATTGTASGQFVPMDAVFSDAPTPDAGASSVGERLRGARSRMGWTLDSAAARTRIKRDYLEALETMDPRGLPSRAYAVGYLRTYSRALGLEPESVIEQFKHEVECDAGRNQPTTVRERREIRLPRGMIGAVAILACVIGAAGWYGSYVTRTEAFAGAPPPADAMLSSNEPAIAEAGRAPSIEAIWAGAPSPRGAEALVLRAQATTFLEVRDSSGRILFSRDLDAGEAYRAPDETGLRITAEDAGALTASVGGTEIGVLGEPGETVELLAASDFVAAGLARTRPVAGEADRAGAAQGG